VPRCHYRASSPHPFLAYRTRDLLYKPSQLSIKHRLKSIMPPKTSLKRKAAPVAETTAKRSKNATTPTTSQSDLEKRTLLMTRPPKDEVCSRNIAADVSSSTAPAYLDMLPDELLLMVLEHFKSLNLPFRSSVLRKLCLTNRRLNKLANSYLYEDFDQRFCRHPSKFVRTVVANGDLAARVMKMSWEYAMEDGIPRGSGVRTSAEIRALRESLKRLDVQDTTALVDQYHQGHPSQNFKIALLHTPNVRILNVYDWSLESR
jgi:hypothetical protein